LPTPFSKNVTEVVFGRRIHGSTRLTDPTGIWNSLNWINVRQLRRIVSRLPWLRVHSGQELLASTFERLAFDEQFANRRSAAVRAELAAGANQKPPPGAIHACRPAASSPRRVAGANAGQKPETSDLHGVPEPVQLSREHDPITSLQ